MSDEAEYVMARLDKLVRRVRFWLVYCAVFVLVDTGVLLWALSTGRTVSIIIQCVLIPLMVALTLYNAREFRRIRRFSESVYRAVERTRS